MLEEGVIITSDDGKQKWQINSIIGSGRCCQVYKGMEVETNRLVALKVYNEGHQYDCAHKREYLLLTIINKYYGEVPQLVKVNASCCLGNQQTLVEEYLGPSLPEILFTVKQQTGHCSLFITYKIVTDIVSALLVLHGCNFVHADIKPDNLMWCPTLCCFKLIDYGLSFSTQDKDVGLVQSTAYRAPEVGCPDQSEVLPGTAIDIWSLGVLILYLLTDKKLNDHQQWQGLCPSCQSNQEGSCENNKIISRLFQQIQCGDEDSSLLQLLQHISSLCLQCKSDKRPSYEDIYSSIQSVTSIRPSYIDMLVLPTSVIRFLNMVDISDVEELDDIKEDITEECNKYGHVTQCYIPTTDAVLGKVFVCFRCYSEAMVVFTKLNGRTFNGRTVITTYFNSQDFSQHIFY